RLSISDVKHKLRRFEEVAGIWCHSSEKQRPYDEMPSHLFSRDNPTLDCIRSRSSRGVERDPTCIRPLRITTWLVPVPGPLPWCHLHKLLVVKPRPAENSLANTSSFSAMTE